PPREADRLCVTKYLTHYQLVAKVPPWPVLVRYAPPTASPSPLTLALQTICATSARPWSARGNSRPCPAGAVWPWALPLSRRPSLRRDKDLRALGCTFGLLTTSSPWRLRRRPRPPKRIAQIPRSFPGRDASFCLALRLRF